MAETAFVLIVENDAEHAQALAERLRREGHACRVVATGAEARESIRSRPPDVVLSAGEMADGANAVGLLEEVRETAPEAEVILMSANAGKGSATAAAGSRGGTGPALLAPSAGLDEVGETVNRAAARAIAAREARRMRERLEGAYCFEGIIGSSPALAKEIRRIRKLAASKSTVLIIGESGTGKELVAQALHACSPRAGKPFKVINCAALSETLLESELFGHVKGAFTGAVSDKKGIVEAADGGTLFLDEVGDTPQAMQAKLLRTLETGEVQRVGSTETRYVDVRFVAATHRNLTDLVESGQFREDLFYRLHAQGAIRLPPLRQRREDITLLAQHFLERANAANATRVQGFSPDVLRRLSNHAWRGNVRELRSVVEQMVVETDNETLDLDDLPDFLRTTTDIVPVSVPSFAGLSMADVEKLHILNTLKLTGGNREKAARILKIGARTLYRKLKDYGMT